MTTEHPDRAAALVWGRKWLDGKSWLHDAEQGAGARYLLHLESQLAEARAECERLRFRIDDKSKQTERLMNGDEIADLRAQLAEARAECERLRVLPTYAQVMRERLAYEAKREMWRAEVEAARTALAASEAKRLALEQEIKARDGEVEK